ncbi:MAG: hypothetical protein IKL53_06585 [Lachnospiraceae bacterium]|nr:hypothetical protein [Lachnospiraceae bacterium]
MRKVLIVVGCNKEKLQLTDKKFQNKMLDFLNVAPNKFDGVISIVRAKTLAGNFNKSGDTIGAIGEVLLDYPSDTIMYVPGYDVDTSKFTRDNEYYICGISTSASVLCIAMSMYSAGLNVKVLTEYCTDRKSKKLESYAHEIMKAYMPDCVV